MGLLHQFWYFLLACFASSIPPGSSLGFLVLTMKSFLSCLSWGDYHNLDLLHGLLIGVYFLIGCIKRERLCSKPSIEFSGPPSLVHLHTVLFLPSPSLPNSTLNTSSITALACPPVFQLIRFPSGRSCWGESCWEDCSDNGAVIRTGVWDVGSPCFNEFR